MSRYTMLVRYEIKFILFWLKFVAIGAFIRNPKTRFFLSHIMISTWLQVVRVQYEHRGVLRTWKKTWRDIQYPASRS